MIESRRLGLAEHVELTDDECIQGFVGSQKERDHHEDRDVGGRI
jgi:hypothetical protein